VVKIQLASRSTNATIRLVSLAVPLLLLGITATSACGVSDDNAKGKTDKGGSSGSGGSGNTGNVAGTGATGNAAGMDVAGGAGPVTPAPCKEGKKQCGGADGNTPQTCDADGVWQDGEACGGTTKVCTGEGVCAAYRLVNAGIDSFGVRPAEPVAKGVPILKEQTLSAAPRTCNKAGLCVTGGIR